MENHAQPANLHGRTTYKFSLEVDDEEVLQEQCSFAMSLRTKDLYKNYHPHANNPKYPAASKRLDLRHRRPSASPSASAASAGPSTEADSDGFPVPRSPAPRKRVGRRRGTRSESREKTEEKEEEDPDKKATEEALQQYYRRIFSYTPKDPDAKMFNAPRPGKVVVEKLEPFPAQLSEKEPRPDSGDEYIFIEKKRKLPPEDGKEEEMETETEMEEDEEY